MSLILSVVWGKPGNSFHQQNSYQNALAGIGHTVALFDAEQSLVQQYPLDVSVYASKRV